MDAEFLSEIGKSREIKFLRSHLRDIADLDRLDGNRMKVLSEAMQLWIAVANAAKGESGIDGIAHKEAAAIAAEGSASTHDAMVNGGPAGPLMAADQVSLLMKALSEM
jgi:hypothetical protein